MLKEFREFAMRGNVVDMAVGIIMGAAFRAGDGEPSGLTIDFGLNALFLLREHRLKLFVVLPPSPCFVPKFALKSRMLSNVCRKFLTGSSTMTVTKGRKCFGSFSSGTLLRSTTVASGFTM
jgi:hypothetical protein